MIRNVSLIILYDKDKKILLQHRTEDAPISPGCWGFFGGAIKVDETPEDAAMREAFEELHYKLKNPKRVLVHDYKSGNRSGKKYYFVEGCTNKQSLKLQEGQDMRWVTFSETKNLKIKESNRDILSKLKTYI